MIIICTNLELIATLNCCYIKIQQKDDYCLNKFLIYTSKKIITIYNFNSTQKLTLVQLINYPKL